MDSNPRIYTGGISQPWEGLRRRLENSVWKKEKNSEEGRYVVAGLNKRTTSEGLREAFSKFGNVVQARVVTDRVSGYSKGFGFVSYTTTEEAAQGIKEMDGKFLDGWVIFAEFARPRPLSS
ncbi:hypothetical protein HPP92_016546 [Vanilla planifolia]|uniref:RRM domain-containing protein n=1 Tax=Vanilla planifolia TaxID=51239 RepID=A0A835QFF2_VANPL|nr:hypothetical protein HPP92_016546 [Vanilla planifolia]